MSNPAASLGNSKNDFDTLYEKSGGKEKWGSKRAFIMEACRAFVGEPIQEDGIDEKDLPVFDRLQLKARKWEEAKKHADSLKAELDFFILEKEKEMDMYVTLIKEARESENASLFKEQKASATYTRDRKINKALKAARKEELEASRDN